MHSHEQLLSDFISSTGTQDRIDAAINECFTHTNILDKIKTIGLDRDTEISLIDENISLQCQIGRSLYISGFVEALQLMGHKINPARLQRIIAKGDQWEIL